MDHINGLPAHPLLVHIPVALLPLAMLGVAVTLIKKAWYERYRWAVLVVGAIGTFGAMLAAASGEGLEKDIRATEGAEAVRAVHEHAEAGDMARNLAILFFVVLFAYVVLPWFLERRAAGRAAAGEPDRPVMPSWLRPALMVAVAVTGVISMVTIVDAGHSGAGQAWKELKTTTAVSDGG